MNKVNKRRFFKAKLGFISKTIFLANLLAIVLLLLSYSAAFINPKDFWPLAFFGLGYLPILLLNIGFIGYWMLRKPVYALITLAPILIGWPLLTQHWKLGWPTDSIAPKAENSLRVMSFNAHLFKSVTAQTEPQIKEQVLEILDQVNPDIICFQEFNSKIKGKNQFTKKIARQIGFEDYYFEPAQKTEYEGYGQAIFSKYKILHAGTITKNGFGINRILYADILKEKDTIRVYNVHLRSFALQNEDKKFIQNPSQHVQHEEHATRRVGRKLRDAFTQRSEQAHSLHQHIQETTSPVVVMGDFNDTPMSYSVNLVGTNLTNTFRAQGKGWGVSHYEMVPFLQIDYIFCSKDFKVQNYQVIKQKISDHYPIWSDLELHKDSVDH